MPAEITSEAVAAWINQQLTKALEQYGFAQISVEISALRSTVSPSPIFRIFVGNGYTTGVGLSIEDCFAALSNQSPKSKAQQKRKEAAALLAEAEKLESETN